MAKDRDQWADTLSAQPTGGWLTSFLADEDKLDRRTLWRLGSWGVGAVAAVIAAILASQSQMQLRREQVASADLLARQSQQIQVVTRETQAESRRLSQAIETLNSDRDRLYTRVTSVEQGLESVTGSIKRQALPAAPAAVAPPAPAAVPAPATATVEPAPPPPAAPALPSVTPSAPLIGPVASAPVADTGTPAKPGAIMAATPAQAAAPLMASKSIMAPPDPAATRLSEPVPETASARPEVVASVQPALEPAAETPAVPVPRTEFGIDLGGANSVDGLRALWRGIARTNQALTGLRPIIMVKERTTGLGMQLRLVVGPLSDAATAAKICAIMAESNRACETSIFDGQRLALKNDPPAEAAAPAKPAAPAPRKRAPVRNDRTERAAPPPVEEPPPPKPQSSLTSFLGLR
ncbi:MAG: hypothetical protein ABWY82_27125 [Tardiphaga sp.]